MAPSRLSAALGRTLHIVVLGVSGVVAAATGLWAVFAIGLLAYGALVAYELQAAPPSTPLLPDGPAFPEVADLIDPQARQAVPQLRAARAELVRLLAALPPHVLEPILPSLLAVPELEGHALRLIERAEELRRYLQTQDAVALRREMDDTRAALDRARDKATWKEHQQALEARGQRLQAIEDLSTTVERIGANLSRIVATVESLPPRLMRLRTIDADTLSRVGGDVGAEVDQMNQELRAFEQTLASLAEPNP